jgi:hypothetical protein
MRARAAWAGETRRLNLSAHRLLRMADFGGVPSHPQTRRDRAVLQVVVLLGQRASAVVSLRTGGVTEVEVGCGLLVPHVQDAKGRRLPPLPRIGGPLCLFSALQAWPQVLCG